jgi:uncharacterized membrane protein
LWALGALVLLAAAAATGQGPTDSATYQDVAPIFARRCVMCHSGPSAPDGLRLDTYDGILSGNIYGAVVKGGDPEGSELIRRVKGISQPRMPMDGPPFLTEGEIAVIERWVAGGLAQGEATADAAPSPVAPPRPAPGETVTYRHAAPVLAARCAKCHTDNGLMGPAPEGLRLDAYAATLATHERVRVVPGHPDASELIRRIRGQARPVMPLDGPPYLALEDIRLLEDWVAQGARSAEGVAAPVPAGSRVRLRGTLGADGSLDGLPLVIGPGTRIDKGVGAGAYVRVEGRLDDRGNVIAERLRAR